MKKIIFILSLQLLIFSASAQKGRMLIGVFTDMWQDVPATTSIKSLSPGVDIYLMQPYQFGKSKMSFAFGLGITSHNMHFDSFLSSDSSGKTVFNKIPEKIGTKDINYSKNKLSVSYLGIPLELRFTANKLRLAIGARAGYLINSKTKYVGDDYIDLTNDRIKIKIKDVKNLNNIVYGGTARIGFKKFNLAGYYDLSTLFNKDMDLLTTPISIGIMMVL